MTSSQFQEGGRFTYWLLIGACALAAGYWIVFLATTGASLWDAFTDALVNVAPVAFLGLVVDRLVRRVGEFSASARLSSFVLGLVAFTLSWYVFIAVGLGVSGLIQGASFRLVWLTGPALVWQGFQSALVFSLLVSLSIAARFPSLPVKDNTQVAAKPSIGPLLVFDVDGELAAIDPLDIMLIEADDDGAIIQLRGRRVRARNGLSTWRQKLDCETFVQVHRSYIVNLQRLISAEPIGGGRMVAHLEGGLTAPVSRSGARLLRERAA